MKRYNTPHRSRVVKTRMTELLAAVGKLTAEYGRIGGKYDLTNAEKDGIGDSSYVSTGVYDEAGVNNVLLRQRWLPGASRFHVGKLSEGG